MVAQLGPLFGTTGHKVKTQGITPSSGLKRGDLEIINYLSDSAGSRNLVVDLSITHDRHGSSSAHPHLNGTLSHPDTPDTPLNEAAKRKVNKYRNTYINHHSISFLPAITSTSSRIHGEFLRLLFLQAHRETENYFAFMVRQRNLTNNNSYSAARHSTPVGRVKWASSLPKPLLCVSI